MLLISLKDNLISIHHLVKFFPITHFILFSLILFILRWRRLKILLNLRPIINHVMMTICNHILLLLWALLMLLLLVFLLTFTIMLPKLFILILFIILFLIMLIIRTHNLTLTINYLILFICVKKSVTMHSWWWLLRLLLVKLVLTWVDFG